MVGLKLTLEGILIRNGRIETHQESLLTILTNEEVWKNGKVFISLWCSIELQHLKTEKDESSITSQH